MFYTGTAKQASDYITSANFVINHIRKTYKEGDDIARAMEQGTDFDFDAAAPTLKVSTETEDAKKELQERQFAMAHSSHSIIEWKNTGPTRSKHQPSYGNNAIRP